MNALMKLYYGTISMGINKKPEIEGPAIQNCDPPFKVKEKPVPLILTEKFIEILREFKETIKRKGAGHKKTVENAKQSTEKKPDAALKIKGKAAVSTKAVVQAKQSTETKQAPAVIIKGKAAAPTKTVVQAKQSTETKQAPAVIIKDEATVSNGVKFLSPGDVAIFNSISNKPKPKKHVEDSIFNIKNNNDLFMSKKTFNLYRNVTKFINPLKSDKNE